MYIKKYWGNFIGGSDDSLNLVAFLEDQKKEEIPLSEIFTKIGLDKQNWASARLWSIWSSPTPVVWKWIFTLLLMWSPTWPPSCWSAASAAV